MILIFFFFQNSHGTKKESPKSPSVCATEAKLNKPALNLLRQSRYKVSDIPPLKRSREKIWRRRQRVKDTATSPLALFVVYRNIFLKLNSLANWEIKSFLKRQPVPGVGRDHSFRSHFLGCSIWLLFLLLFSGCLFCPGAGGIWSDSRRFALERDKCFPTFFISSFVSASLLFVRQSPIMTFQFYLQHFSITSKRMMCKYYCSLQTRLTVFYWKPLIYLEPSVSTG